MERNLRKTGIDVLGDIPWGTHFCQFYETKEDLLTLLVPYFKTGLENNEYCFWIGSNPFNIEKVVLKLKLSIPFFDEFIARKSFEIIPVTEWYLKQGRFNATEIINKWNSKISNVLERGYEGIRIHDYKGWLDEEDWKNFIEYEKELIKTISHNRIILLNTYPLAKSNASMLLDVVQLHRRIISTRKGNVKILEETEIREMKEELQNRNIELEKLVQQRTHDLEKVIEEFKSEIAERKKAQEQLIKEKELSNQVLDSMPGIVTVADKNLRYIRWNKNFEVIAGDAAKENRIMHIGDFAADENARQTVREFFQEMFLNKRTSGELSATLKNGETITLHVTGRKIDYEGKPCVLAISVDITERKKMEEQLRNEKNLSNEIIDSIPGLFALFDGNMKFIRWNKSFELVSGYTPKEILKLHGIDSFYDNEEDKKKTAEILAEIFEKGSGSAEVSPLMKDDKPVPIFFIGRSFKYKGKTHLITTGIDISDRKMAEEKLRQSETLLAEAEHLAKVGSWSLDLRTNRVTWSDEVYRIFGVEPLEFDPRLETVIEFSHPDDKDTVLQIVEQGIKTKKPYDFHYRIRRPDGEERILHVSGTVMADEEGNAVREYGAVQDVTESKKAEEMLKQSYQQIRLLTEHLQNIREEERTYIARELHDELGQQITVLKMDVSWLTKKLSDGESLVKEKLHELNQLLDAMVQSVRRISLELRPSMLDDLGLAAAMDWHLKEFEKRSGIKTFFSEPSEELSLTNPIKTSLYRIFQESLTNVARHSKATQLSVALEKKDNELLLSIRDNGQGFDTRKASQKVTLGILGMKERAAMIGGNYHIETEPAKGTTVTVSLPL